MKQLESDLKPIIAKIGPEGKNTGNSKQDLMLTAMGWHFGSLVDSGKFQDTNQAAAWLDRNLGPHTDAEKPTK